MQNKAYVKPDFVLKSPVAEENIPADGLGYEAPIVSCPNNWVTNDD